MSKDLTKTEVKSIVADEIKKFISDKLDNEIEKIITKSTSKARKAHNQLTKDALSKLAEFLWIRRNIWQKDIK